MTNYFDDDSPFWEEQADEATSQIERVSRRTRERTRTHHVVTRDTPRPRPQLIDDDGVDTMWLESKSRTGERRGPFGAVDPRLMSIGAIAIAAVLAVPLFSALGNKGDDDGLRSVAEATPETTIATTLAPTTSVIEVTAAVNPDSVGTTESAGIEESSESESDSGSNSESDSLGGGGSGAQPAALRSAPGCSNAYEAVAGDYWLRIAEASGTSLDELLALNQASAETAIFPGSTVCLPDGAAVSGGSSTGDGVSAGAAAAAECTNKYVTAAGDYWLRIAEASGATLDDLLAANGATTETPLYPGAEVCLPAGASAPAPPTSAESTAAATTAVATTEATTTAPPTTAAPATTQPQSTAPRAPAPSGGEVEQMIRDIWPDDLEEQALRIAWRESNYRPHVTSPTGCCHGVFQIHWESHRSWLSDIGITSRDQLFDARMNIEAAYTLYQRSGWGPWAATRD